MSELLNINGGSNGGDIKSENPLYAATECGLYRDGQSVKPAHCGL